MNKKAFTLIELLVVIAIIGILSGFIFISMSGATSAAKDAKRKANIDSIRKALLMYKVQTGNYPVEATACNVGSNCSTLASALVPTYLGSLPTDPNSGTYYTYVSATGTDFTVGSVLSDSTGYSYTASTGFSGGLSPVAGACGTKNGKYAASTPNGTEACSAGTVSGMTGTYSWTCAGLNGGSPSSTCATVAAAYTAVSFTTIGTTAWTVPAGVTSIDYLIVAGGGGGGGYGGGGGGAGGLRTGALSVSGSVSAIVGAGGAGGAAGGYNNGSQGNNSSISFGAGDVEGTNLITAIGGGFGSTPSYSGGNGGSGGGAGHNGSQYAGGTGSQGNQGGINYTSSPYPTGAGGGAGSAGGAASGSVSGAGGNGYTSTITGTSVCYAGGGGGAATSYGATHGHAASGCGGGDGGESGGASQHGIANTGGGGGGGYGYISSLAAGNGGSGIVVIRYINNY